MLEQIAQVANLESVSKYGHTALSLAASWDEVWSFEVLIAAGASLTVKDRDGDTGGKINCRGCSQMSA